MDGAVILAIGIMAAICLLIVVAAGQMEAYYYRRHPPDEGDGCMEDNHEHD